jgi:hypothetical protein
MSPYRIIVLEHAVSELEQACKYYNDKVIGLGFELEAEVFAILQLIKGNPLLFPIKFANIHEAVVSRFPYIITYEIIGNRIIISAIFHTKQNPSKKSKRNPKQ